MTHPAVIKTSQLILAGDIHGAESALTEIADSEGDFALVAVLDEVAPKDLLAIMRSFDGSRQSVVNMLVTPEQFATETWAGIREAGRGGRLLRSAGAGPDHPTHPALPESAYLKFLAYALD